jgi:hypothetical protein
LNHNWKAEKKTLLKIGRQTKIIVFPSWSVVESIIKLYVRNALIFRDENNRLEKASKKPKRKCNLKVNARSVLITKQMMVIVSRYLKRFMFFLRLQSSDKYKKQGTNARKKP